MTILEKIEFYNQKPNYHITIEVGNGRYRKYLDTSDIENGDYYVEIYYGDNGNASKPGTLQGIGRGFHLEEAFDNAVKDIKLINGK